MSSFNEPVVFVVPGDLHFTEAGLENHRVAQWVVDQVNDLIRPDFVQFIGDNVQDATEPQFQLFDDLRKRLGVPHFALVGDHDVKDDPEALGFQAHLGPTFGSTRLRGFRFLRLNTQQAKPVGISADQLNWFRGEVDAALASGERVLIFQHNYPYQIWEDFDGPGIDDWRAIVQTRTIQGIVCGHTHYSQIANDGRNLSIATRSIGDPEGGPPGYAIGFVHGEDLAISYRTIDDQGPIVMVTHPREALLTINRRQIVVGPDQFRVQVWSALKIVEVRGRLDDGPWFGFVEGGPRQEHSGAYEAPLEGEGIEKGIHTLEVEAIDASGAKSEQKIEFASDTSGRFTAVPSTYPSVLKTEFC